MNKIYMLQSCFNLPKYLRMPFIRKRPILSQFLLIGFSILLYFGIRSLTQGSSGAAFSHAQEILNFETMLHLDIERSMHLWALQREYLVSLFNWIYIWGHWPVIIFSLIWLYKRHTNEYFTLRNAMFVSGTIGMVIYAFFPVAPPRLLPGYVDTIAENSSSYRVLQPPALSNIYAAFPSLHFGWNLLVAIVIYRAKRSKSSLVFLLISPILMGLAIILTANHYIVDAIGGGVLALVGLIAVLRRDLIMKTFCKIIKADTNHTG